MDTPASLAALNRFGPGGRPPDAYAVAGTLQQWVLDQVALGKVNPVKSVPDGAGPLHTLAAFRKAKRGGADKAGA